MSLTVPTVDRGELAEGRCSMAIAGPSPSTESTSGLSSWVKNWRAEGDRDAAIAAAQAEAEQVKLSGQAEALIVLTKGEAEAKALEMQADAYSHFNDAAILATVLRELPEIVAAGNRAGTANHLTESVVETSHARRD